MSIRFVRFGSLVGSYSRPKEDFVEGALLRLSKFFMDWDQLVDDYRKIYTRQWLAHRSPVGVRGVYAFVEGIINRSLLSEGTRTEPTIFEAPGAIWAKFKPDGTDLPVGEWMRYSTADEVYSAIIARGDWFISEHNLAEKAWPWDVVSDYSAEFFIEM